MMIRRYEEDDGHGEHSSSEGTAVMYVQYRRRRKGSVTVVETLQLSCLDVSLPTSFLGYFAI
jgi:hypothetical protein